MLCFTSLLSTLNVPWQVSKENVVFSQGTREPPLTTFCNGNVPTSSEFYTHVQGDCNGQIGPTLTFEWAKTPPDPTCVLPANVTLGACLLAYPWSAPYVHWLVAVAPVPLILLPLAVIVTGKNRRRMVRDSLLYQNVRGWAYVLVWIGVAAHAAAVPAVFADAETGDVTEDVCILRWVVVVVASALVILGITLRVGGVMAEVERDTRNPKKKWPRLRLGFAVTAFINFFAVIGTSVAVLRFNNDDFCPSRGGCEAHPALVSINATEVVLVANPDTRRSTAWVPMEGVYQELQLRFTRCRSTATLPWEHFLWIYVPWGLMHLLGLVAHTARMMRGHHTDLAGKNLDLYPTLLTLLLHSVLALIMMLLTRPEGETFVVRAPLGVVLGWFTLFTELGLPAYRLRQQRRADRNLKLFEVEGTVRKEFRFPVLDGKWKDHHVFISYKQKTSFEKVHSFREKLGRIGGEELKIWLDTEQRDNVQSVEDAVEGSLALLVFLSTDAKDGGYIASEFCRRQLRAAQKLKMRGVMHIIVVCDESVTESTLKVEVQKFEHEIIERAKAVADRHYGGRGGRVELAESTREVKEQRLQTAFDTIEDAEESLKDQASKGDATAAEWLKELQSFDRMTYKAVKEMQERVLKSLLPLSVTLIPVASGNDAYDVVLEDVLKQQIAPVVGVSPDAVTVTAEIAGDGLSVRKATIIVDAKNDVSSVSAVLCGSMSSAAAASVVLGRGPLATNPKVLGPAIKVEVDPTVEVTRAQERDDDRVLWWLDGSIPGPVQEALKGVIQQLDLSTNAARLPSMDAMPTTRMLALQTVSQPAIPAKKLMFQYELQLQKKLQGMQNVVLFVSSEYPEPLRKELKRAFQEAGKNLGIEERISFEDEEEVASATKLSIFEDEEIGRATRLSTTEGSKEIKLQLDGVNHELQMGNIIRIDNIAPADATFGGITAAEIIGDHSITAVEASSITITLPEPASMTDECPEFNASIAKQLQVPLKEKGAIPVLLLYPGFFQNVNLVKLAAKVFDDALLLYSTSPLDLSEHKQKMKEAVAQAQAKGGRLKAVLEALPPGFFSKIWSPWPQHSLLQTVAAELQLHVPVGGVSAPPWWEDSCSCFSCCGPARVVPNQGTRVSGPAAAVGGGVEEQHNMQLEDVPPWKAPELEAPVAPLVQTPSKRFFQ